MSLNAETTEAPLLVFADDWGRHPSSCQHLIRQFLPEREVLWVNTIGMRPPRLDLVTLFRASEKVRQWLRPSAKPATPLPSANGPRVVNPRMWPWFRGAASRRLNAWLLTRQLRPLIEAMPAPPVAVTTIPIVADLFGMLPVERWVYYCVDDFAAWPGLDQGPLAEMETKLIREADVLVAVSENLCRRIESEGRHARLMTHGVDLEHWRSGAGELPPEIAGLPRPLVVFWGVVDLRLDVDALTRLAGRMAGGTILLAGPRQNPDPRVAALPRVVMPGPLAYGDLPAVAREAAVLIMPYADLPVTQAIQPLKLKEYLATGRPVVVSDLPATRPWSDAMDLATGADAFADAVLSRLDGRLPAGQAQARERLDAEGWTAKAGIFAEWAFQAPEAGREPGPPGFVAGRALWEGA